MHICCYCKKHQYIKGEHKKIKINGVKSLVNITWNQKYYVIFTSKLEESFFTQL